LNLSEPFIRRPVATTLVVGAFFLFGGMAYFLLPVSVLPTLDFPTILVTANLPGASPETMANAVALPLERQFSAIDGLDSMTSTSTLGVTRITLQFNLSRTIDGAALDVQTMIARSLRLLPGGMPTPPFFQKVNPADQPVLYLTLRSSTLPLSAVNEFADTVVVPRISTVRGVAQVLVFGAQKFAVRAMVDPGELAARGIGIDEVSSAVGQGNVDLPTGTLFGSNWAYNVQTEGQLYNAAQFRDLVVAWRDGAPVRLSDLGQVVDGVENDRIATWRGDERALVLAVQRQPGTNTIEVVDGIRALIPSFLAEKPAAIDLEVLFDNSVFIRESVADVKFTLFLAMVLVVLVIFLFLRNAPATAIPSVTLPASIVFTFAAMYLLGFSLDNLSLMALILAVGFVVDDAIVMLENIVRHMERGEAPLAAALAGSREISFTILSMTLSLVAVFIPVLFMGGILGRLLREFAVTISVAILVSGFVSLTLTPMLCSRFLAAPGAARHGRLYALSEAGFAWLRRAYEATLRPVLGRPRMMLGVFLAVLAATAWMFAVIPKGFIPTEDSSQIFAFTEAAQGISFDAMMRHQRELAAIIGADPDVEAFMSTVGSGGGLTTGNTGVIFIRLAPLGVRKRSVDQVIAGLRRKTAGVVGIRLYLQNLPPIRIGGLLTKSQYQYTLQGPDVRDLYSAVPALEAALRSDPRFLDVTSDLQLANPQATLRIDRRRAAELGVSIERIESSLGAAYGGMQVSTIYAPNNQYQVILQVDPRFQTDPASLSRLFLRSSTGKLVPLESVVRAERTVGPAAVNHLGQLPSATVSFALGEGVSIGDGVAGVRKAARATLPDSVTGTFQGTAQAFQSSFRGMGLLLAMAVLVIYIILGILYEDFVHPLTILSGLPSAALGALATLVLFRQELNLYGFVGVIMLVGIVKKNGIMMIDFALSAQREEGAPPEEAILQGALIRFRPIMMTTMAALVGTLPIAIGIGAGAEARRPLGLAVVGGLLLSQLVTLYLTPVFYISLERLRSRGGKKGPARTAPPP